MGLPAGGAVKHRLECDQLLLFVVGITVEPTGSKRDRPNKSVLRTMALTYSNLDVQMATKLRLEPRCENLKRACTTLHAS